MNITKLLFTLLAISSLAACDDVEGTVTIKNEISNMEISDVKFGDYTVAYSLLPGQDNSLIIYDKEDGFPKTCQTSFKMTSNNKVVYLVTLDDYVLDQGTEITITLSDSTKVE